MLTLVYKALAYPILVYLSDSDKRELSDKRLVLGIDVFHRCGNNVVHCIYWFGPFTDLPNQD